MKKLIFTFFALSAFTIGMQAQQAQPKKVMVEEFTQASCPPCAAANPGFNAFLRQNADKVVAIKYQTSWPGTDPMNAQTETWVAPRVDYYGVQGVPDGYMNGASQSGAGPLGFTQAALDDAYSQPANFNIDIAHSYNAGNTEVTLTITVTANQDLTGLTNLKLQTALIEDEVHFATAPGTNGEKEFYSVMRKMFPNATGTALPATWTAGQTETITFTETVPNYIYNPYEMAIACFIQQNNAAKTIHQAAHHEIDPVLDFDGTVNAINNVSSALTCVETGTLQNFSPIITFENLGYQEITTINFETRLGNTLLGSHTWTGSLTTGTSEEITLSPVNINSSGTLTVRATSINGSSDLVSANNAASTVLTLINTIPTASPVAQNYVSTAFPPAGWARLNPDGDATWIRAAAGNGNSGSAKMDFYNISSGTDELLMPVADLAGFNNAILNFDVAYAFYTSTQGDLYDDLYVYASTNCGASWTEVYHKAGEELSTAPASGSAFTPTAAQWRTETVDMSAFAGQGVLVKFTGVSSYGNNLYVDNVNLAGSNSCVPPSVNTASSPTQGNANNGTASASVLGGTAPYTYLWSNGATTSTLNGLAAGEYCVIVTDASGCAAESACVTVEAISSVTQPNQNGITFYSQPNPSNQYAVIKIEGVQTNATLSISDITGKLLRNIPVNAGTQTLDINTSAMAPGTYICQLIANNQAIATHKLVVVR